MSDLKVVVAGAGGRMGLSNIAAITRADELTLHAAFDRAGADAIGQDAGLLAHVGQLHVVIGDDAGAALAGADALVDFTAPAVSVALSRKAAEQGLIHVIGTTGCSEADEAEFRKAARNGAIIIKSGNMSLGVNLLAALVKKASAALGEDFDAEIVEMHHNQKVDAPSGTALMLGEAVAEGRGVDFNTKAVRSREGQVGARQKGEIGFATLRGGNVVGDHTVMLVSGSERIELTHKAQDRGLFSDGVVKALKWARGKAPGYYTMADVLGLNGGE